MSQNDLVREGLKRIIDSDDFGVEVMDKSVDLLLTRNPPCQRAAMIVIDLGNCGWVEPDEIAAVREHYPAARVVFLHDGFDFDTMVAAFRCGGDGYIVKSIAHEPLIESLRLVAMGEKVMPSALAQFLPECGKAMHHAQPAVDLIEMFSAREIQTLRCLSQGDPNKVIARKLDITEATVKVHVKAILRKLGLRNRTEAAAWTLHAGIDLLPEPELLPPLADDAADPLAA